MLAGELYDPYDTELVEMNRRARELLHGFNFSPPAAVIERREIIRQLFGAIGEDFEINPPFLCDYGANIIAGEKLYLNYGCVILDCNTVYFGHHVRVAPNVQIYTAHHPLNPEERRGNLESASPIKIDDDVWIGGGAIILPGVTIGAGTTIGAGSVVTKDIPAGVLAAGNPCRVIRQIESFKLEFSGS